MRSGSRGRHHKAANTILVACGEGMLEVQEIEKTVRSWRRPPISRVFAYDLNKHPWKGNNKSLVSVIIPIFNEYEGIPFPGGEPQRLFPRNSRLQAVIL